MDIKPISLNSGGGDCRAIRSKGEADRVGSVDAKKKNNLRFA